MRHQIPEILKNGRITTGVLASDESFGWNGAFQIRGPIGLDLVIIVSDGMGWEHVSVQELPPSSLTKQKTPSWETMCWVKDLVWDENETVVQYHPRKRDYVNNHPYVLHLWRPTREKLPKPSTLMVGVK